MIPYLKMVFERFLKYNVHIFNFSCFGIVHDFCQDSFRQNSFCQNYFCKNSFSQNSFSQNSFSQLTGSPNPVCINARAPSVRAPSVCPSAVRSVRASVRPFRPSVRPSAIDKISKSRLYKRASFSSLSPPSLSLKSFNLF